MTEESLKAARMGWDSTWALVNVALVPQNTHGLGISDASLGDLMVFVPSIARRDAAPLRMR